MSFPQPDSNSYAAGGSQFFRLNTLLASPGDIYESEQSGHAFAIGADSDMSRVNVAYFDKQAPNLMNMTTLGPERAFVGRIEADNLGTYLPSQRPGRVLMWPDELWNPNPIAALVAPADTQIIVTPRLDVIEYFKPQGSLEVKRNDKVFAFQRLDIPATVTGLTADALWLVLPYYGRKYANIDFSAPVAPSVDIDVYGIKLQIDAAAVYARPLYTAIGTTAFQLTIQAGLQGAFPTPRGMYDLLAFAMRSNTPGVGTLVNLNVLTSDTPAE
jgi:hypothetical protein